MILYIYVVYTLSAYMIKSLITCRPISAIHSAAEDTVNNFVYACRKQCTFAKYSTSEPHFTSSVCNRL